MQHTAASWYVADAEGNAYGPYTRQQLDQMRQAAQVSEDHLVWCLEWSEWHPLRRLQGTNAQAALAATGGNAERSAGSASAGRASSGNAQPKRKQSTPPKVPKAAAKPAEDSAESGKRFLIALRRWLARGIDTLWLGGIATGLLVWLWLSQEPELASAEALFPALWLLPVLLLVPVETLILAIVGQTPGKALLGLRVLTAEGSTPGLGAAFLRTRILALRGQALGIPLLGILANIAAGSNYIQQQQTRWDERAGTKVIADEIDVTRWVAALFLLIMGAGLWSEGYWITGFLSWLGGL